MKNLTTTVTTSLLVFATTSHGQSRLSAVEVDPRDAVVSAMGLADGEVVGLDLQSVGIGESFSVELPVGARDEMLRIDFVRHVFTG